MPASSGAIRAGRAFVEILGDDTKLQATLKQSEARFSRWGKLIAGIGVAVSAALLSTTVAFAKIGDQLDKMSLRTGVGVQALSELKFAAEQTGADVESLERGFLKLSRTLADAERGSATAVEALDKIGLSADQLRGKSPEEQLQLIADGMQGLADDSQKAAVAQEIFGRGGAQLLPLLKAGASGIAALRQEARDLGITLTDEDAKSAADLTDAMNRLWSVVRAGSVIIGGTLAPIVTELANKTTAYVTVIGDWIREHREAVILAVKLALATVAFGSGLLATAAAIRVVLFVMAAYRAAQKAVAISTAAVLALSGPAGWAALAAGVAVAAVAVIATAKAFDELESSADAAQRKIAAAQAAANDAKKGPGGIDFSDVESAGSGAPSLDAGKLLGDLTTLRNRINELRQAKGPFVSAQVIGETQDALEKIGQQFAKLEAEAVRPVDQLTQALRELQHIQREEGVFTSAKAREFAEAVKEQIAEVSGLAAEMRRLEQEIAKLEGRDTKLAELFDAGALPEQLDALQQKLAELDKAKGTAELQDNLRRIQQELDLVNGKLTETDIALQEAAAAGVDTSLLDYYRELTAQLDAARDAQQKLANDEREAERIREQTRTPEEKFAAELERLKELKQGGQLDADTFGRAARDLLERRQNELAKAGDSADKRASSVTGTFSARAAAGIAAAGPEKQIAANTKKTVQLLEQQLQELRKQEPDLFT